MPIDFQLNRLAGYVVSLTEIYGWLVSQSFGSTDLDDDAERIAYRIDEAIKDIESFLRTVRAERGGE